MNFSDIRIKAVRMDTNKTIMDFQIHNLETNLTMYLNKSKLEGKYDARFTDAWVVEKGTMLKHDTDAWKFHNQIVV